MVFGVYWQYIFSHMHGTSASIHVIHVHRHFWCCKDCCKKRTGWCHWSEWGSVRDKTRTTETLLTLKQLSVH